MKLKKKLNTVTIACGLVFSLFSFVNAEPKKDVAYFQAHPEQLEQFMADVEQRLDKLTDQVESGDIDLNDFENKTNALLESPEYIAAYKVERENRVAKIKKNRNGEEETE